jgi:F0F1-type ATP synthase membrane subunit c/vacuolar-type H+-ATPase subunit K
MRTLTGLWRWRSNALRRRTDLAESCAALAAALLIGLGTPVAGLTVGFMVQESLDQAVAEQHRERHLVTATAVRPLGHAPVDPDAETSSARDAHRLVLANWTAPDGSRHTEAAQARRDTTPGDRFRVWVDDHGRLVPRPLDSSTAGSHAALAGIGTAAASTGLVEGARRLVVWRLMQRRYAQWDLAWERARQDWGRTGADS